MQIKLCKLHNAKQIIRDKLRKYIKKHQLSQMIKLNLSEKNFYAPFRQVINLPQNGIPKYLMPHSILILKCRV